MYLKLRVLLLLTGIASARKCQELQIPIVASGRNGVFDLAAPANNIDVTNFLLNLNQQGANYSDKILTGYATVSGHYHISATYCEPDSGPSSALQILTHGLGADKTYWDLSYNDYNYSYVKVAVEQYGFSTFAWDRLGIAQSSHGDPINEIQAPLEVAALEVLIRKIKHGKIRGMPKSFEKIVLGGHSYGSQHTYAITAMHPNIADCIILQGWSLNGSFVQLFDFGGDFIQANTFPGTSDYPDGYYVNGDAIGFHTDFISPHAFDPGLLIFLAKNRQPITPGERLSGGSDMAAKINKFAGPVHVVTGDRDIPFCGGNCLAAPTGYSSIPATANNSFVNAENFKITIVPDSGHGLNFEYSHPFTYHSMNSYLANHGCAPRGWKDNAE